MDPVALLNEDRVALVEPDAPADSMAPAPAGKPAERKTLLATERLTCRFGGLVAVDDVSFSLKEGEIRAVIGPNGAGKTTFVSLLCGRVAPTSGTVHFRGMDVTRLPAHRKVQAGIAYTAQITNVFAKLTAYDNVMLAAESRTRDGAGRRRTTANARERARRALHAVGLEERMHETADRLAYGHQRLLEVAMGLALEPALLILDEPTQGLSDPEIDDFCKLIRVISASTTILLIEHNMRVVMELADRITVLNRGQILAEGTSEEIRDNRDVQIAYLGT